MAPDQENLAPDQEILAPDQENVKVPPEQEHLNRQLEALGRFVADFQQQREHAKAAPAQPPPAPEGRRPSRFWLLVTGGLVVVALVGGVAVGAVAWFDDRPATVETGARGASSPTQGPTTTAAGQGPDTTPAAPVASLACKTAVDRANAMLAIAVTLQRELDEYSRFMRDPSNGTLSVREVVDKRASSLQAGADDSARFDQALAAYRQVVDQCQLQAP
jgi:hypothetical protein